MLTRLTIVLDDEEISALRQRATRELRDMKEQARYILRCDLLAADPTPAQPMLAHPARITDFILAGGDVS